MLTFRCPGCNVSIPLWPGVRARFSRQGRRGKRQCPGCGAWLELRNGYFLGAAYGLMLGVIIGASHFLPWSNDWTRLGVLLVFAVVLGFTAAPLLLRRFGRWWVLADGCCDSPEFTRWSRVSNTYAWIAVAALFLVQLVVYLEVRHLLSRLLTARTTESLDALFHRTMLTIGLTYGAGLAVSAVSLVVSIRAEVRRQRAREAEHQNASSS